MVQHSVPHDAGISVTYIAVLVTAPFVLPFLSPPTFMFNSQKTTCVKREYAGRPGCFEMCLQRIEATCIVLELKGELSALSHCQLGLC